MLAFEQTKKNTRARGCSKPSSEPPALTLNFDFDWPSAAKPRAPLRLSNKVSLSSLSVAGFLLPRTAFALNDPPPRT